MTYKQQRFVLEYIVDGNATRAAIAAGYSQRSAASTAADLVKHPVVAREIERHGRKLLKKVEINVEWIAEQYRIIASADIRKAYRPDGTLKLPHEWDDETAAVIAGIETTEIVTEIKARKGRKET